MGKHAFLYDYPKIQACTKEIIFLFLSHKYLVWVLKQNRSKRWLFEVLKKFKLMLKDTLKLDYMELLKMKLRCSFGYVNPYTSLGQMQKEKTQVKHRIKSGV